MTQTKLSSYTKVTLILVGIFMFISMLSIAKAILLPVIYACFIAILLEPAVRFMVKKGFNRALAALIVLILAISLLAGVVAFLASQASKLEAAWPELNRKIQELIRTVTTFFSRQFDLSNKEIDAYIGQMQDEMLSNGGSKIGITLTVLGRIISTVILTPVYTFMLLYYEPHILRFLHKLFTRAYDKRVTDVLTKTKSLVHHYLFGLSIEIGILAVLNTLGLLLVGIDYAILLGVTGAFLNLIPYLGGIIAVTTYTLVALLTKSPVHMLYVIGIYSVIQFFDNNFVVPKILGSKVKLNALVSFFAVIAGAALWGIPGMFLAIPILGIVKLILDVSPSLKHWGEFLGEPMEVAKPGWLVRRRKKALRR
ncbi:MAG: AI-2E family transporter [Bacteroidia bacterium]